MLPTAPYGIKQPTAWQYLFVISVVAPVTFATSSYLHHTLAIIWQRYDVINESVREDLCLLVAVSGLEPTSSSLLSGA
ncbi:MAG: hypothetical protein JW732_07690 [Dehalococcoidia bacterium]|nr:hypothetical protein [Dehalococcoidia bacterium]